ncbi:MAG: hypothetical protein E7236_01940 [Lachnospiraceae bacterium]|nr:hypothetical protein [Lachnospiraceae bacterium]
MIGCLYRMHIFRKTCNLITGFLLAVFLACIFTQLIFRQSCDQSLLSLMLLFLIIYLVTFREHKYRLLPVWKRFLRVILLPVVLFAGVVSAILVTIVFSDIPLRMFPDLQAIKSPMKAAVAAIICLVILLCIYMIMFNPIANISTRKLEQMEGHEFEAYCAKVLKRNGYKSVHVTQGSSDYGADIIARKHGRKWVIQCKRYSTVVGSAPIQEISASMQYYQAKKAAVITNSTFTANAKRLADANGILLIDGDALSKMSKRI